MSFVVWLCWLGSVAFADPPLSVPHQGRLVDASGIPVTGTVNLRVTLYDTAAAPSGFWTRLFSNVAVDDGYYAVTLTTDDAAQPLDLADFDDGEVYVGVHVGTTELLPRQALGSVPFALSAGTAGSAGGTGLVPSVTLQSGDGTRCLKLEIGAGYNLASTAVNCTTGAALGLVQSGGVWTFAGGALTSCLAYKQHATYTNQGSGAYSIDPDGSGPNASFDAYCEMDTDGGGWTFLGHAETNYAGTGGGKFFEQNVGTYFADRRDNGLTYSVGAKLLPYIGHTEMMGTLDAASPASAAAASKIMFYKYAAGNAAFNTGPIPCTGLANGFQYRTATTGAYTSGGTTNGCNAAEWYPRNVGNTQYLLLFDGNANGNYWGAGMGGNNTWNHDGWWYVR
jgi:hypothetical protein